ncbi:MAG: hypothetical protein PVJ49_10855, partial [Acidobacteriota bacterium]
MRRMTVPCLILVLALATAAGAVPQQDEISRRFDEAFFAWDSGDFAEGLQGFLDVLEAPDGERFFDDIALITGELYVTEEIAADGSNVRISPDGVFASWETRAEEGTVTHVRRLGSGQTLTIDGSGLIFAPSGGMVAYLVTDQTEELVAAREALAAVDTSDRDAARAAQQRVREAEVAAMRIETRDLASMSPSGRAVDMGSFTEVGMTFSSDGRTLFVAGAWEGTADGNDLVSIGLDGPTVEPRNVTEFAGFKAAPVAIAGGEFLLYTIPQTSPVARATAGFGGGRGGRGGGGASARFAVVDLASGAAWDFEGDNPVVSADGSTIAFTRREDGETVLEVMSVGISPQPREVFRTADQVGELAISPSGNRLVTQIRLREDWELFLIDAGADEKPAAPTPAEGEGEVVRLTHEIQHDLAPRFLTDDTVLAVIGEGRHRRSYLYDVNSLQRTRLFHNN